MSARAVGGKVRASARFGVHEIVVQGRCGQGAHYAILNPHDGKPLVSGVAGPDLPDALRALALALDEVLGDGQ
jgi:hypothetical protein